MTKMGFVQKRTRKGNGNSILRWVPDNIIIDAPDGADSADETPEHELTYTPPEFGAVPPQHTETTPETKNSTAPDGADNTETDDEFPF